MLHRYWLRFARSDTPSVLSMGCGITAYDEEDAKRLFEREVVPIFGRGEIVEIIQDIDVRTLDEGHVRPNMGAPSNRGVWFPRL
jgi:hypothetical protein